MDLKNGNIRAKVSNETVSSQGLSQDEQKLKETSQEFEAVFISLMLSQMRNNVMKSDLFGKGQEEGVWNSMMDQELAKTWAKNDGVGLANLLFQQLSQNTGKSK